MGKSAVFEKLEAIADDFACGVWSVAAVLSPQLYFEKAQNEYRRQPSPTSKARFEQAKGKWAIVFNRGPVPNARGGLDSDLPLETAAAFTPQEVRDMDPDSIRRTMIGTIVEREVHEVLEWAQLRSHPGVPIVNPHKFSEELEDVIRRVAIAIFDHAAIGQPIADT